MNEHAGFDESFETKRLEMLLNQYAESKHAIGEVRFVVDEDGRLGKATWTFDDDPHALFQDSDFKWQLMELFDAFIIYRLEHGFNDVSTALLSMNEGTWSLSWQ